MHWSPHEFRPSPLLLFGYREPGGDAMRRIRAILGSAVLVSAALVATPTALQGGAGAATLADPGVVGCDVLVTAPAGHSCMLPWPNDAFTVSAKTPTGRMIHITTAIDPANKSGVHVNPLYQDRNDGFSPGSVILVPVPGLDVAQSGIAPSTDIGASFNETAPIMLFDTSTGARVPYFAELDAQAADTPSEQLLLIHPATSLLEGHRYVVDLQQMKNASGAVLPSLPSMTAALNATSSSSTRLRHLQGILNYVHLGASAILGSSAPLPYLAWDFTVASSQSLSTPALTMRTLAYKWLATHHLAYKGSMKTVAANYAPAFTVTSSVDTAGTRDIHGTFQVPLFLKDAGNFSSMNATKAGVPVINGSKTWTANFICVLPSTLNAAGAATPTVYGHGLLGSAGEVEGGSFRAGVAANMMGCATDWVGMSGKDILNVARNLGEMSTFYTQTDHMLQGLINFQFLGRLINSPAGFASSTAFQDGAGHSLFKVGDCHFMGYSQGGIMGGAASAISTEWTRVILGVPGMDYGGLLLNRSVDWNEFASIFVPAYPDRVDQQIVLQMAQMLWDRGENEGYVQHLTSHPYPGIPVKKVFLIENFGDHQVSNLAGDMLARTIGAANHQPAFNPSFQGGTPRLNPPVVAQWGLPKLDQTKAAPAGVVLWDYGTPTPPTVNHAPDDASFGSDPHGYGRGNTFLMTQVTTFMSTGIIPNLCGDNACQSTTP